MAQAKIRIIPGRRSGITSPPCFTALHTAAQSFVNGAPVTLASAGTIQAVTTTSYTKTHSVSTVSHYITHAPDLTTMGIAMGDASASSAKTVGVSQLAKGQQYIGNLIHATQSSAKVSKLGDTVYLARYDGYGSSVSSASSNDTHWGWSLSAPGGSPANASCVMGKVVGLIDAASTVNGRVLVDILRGGQMTPDQT